MKKKKDFQLAAKKEYDFAFDCELASMTVAEFIRWNPRFDEAERGYSSLRPRPRLLDGWRATVGSATLTSTRKPVARKARDCTRRVLQSRD